MDSLYSLNITCQGSSLEFRRKFYEGFGRVGGGRRGEVRGFSRQSRRRLHMRLNHLDFSRMAREKTSILECTLTVPPSLWYSSSRVNLAFKRFTDWLHRGVGAGNVWKFEQGRGGLPHFHLAIFGVYHIPVLQIREKWAQYLGIQELPRVSISRVKSLQAFSRYLGKYMSKESEVIELQEDVTGAPAEVRGARAEGAALSCQKHITPGEGEGETISAGHIDQKWGRRWGVVGPVPMAKAEQVDIENPETIARVLKKARRIFRKLESIRMYRAELGRMRKQKHKKRFPFKAMTDKELQAEAKRRVRQRVREDDDLYWLRYENKNEAEKGRGITYFMPIAARNSDAENTTAHLLEIVNYLLTAEGKAS